MNKQILKKFQFDENKLEKIKKTVENVEKQTSAEISLVLANSSNDYSFWELLFSLICGSISVFVMLPFTDKINLFLDSLFWISYKWYLPAFFFAVFLVVTGVFYCISNIPLIDRIIVNRKIRSKYVYQKALEQFVLRKVYKTKQSNGVLIYFSVLEKQIQILADEGTVKYISSDVWKQIADKLAIGFAEKNPTEVIINSVEECGHILQKYFPYQENDVNELPDGLVIIEGGD